jgi:hypothetical protein
MEIYGDAFPRQGNMVEREASCGGGVVMPITMSHNRRASIWNVDQIVAQRVQRSIVTEL